MRSKTLLLIAALVLVVGGLFSLISLVTAASGGGNQVYYPAVGEPSEMARVDSNLWLSTESSGSPPLIWANAETGRWVPQNRIANSVDSFDQDLWVLGGNFVSLYDGTSWTQWSTWTALAIGQGEHLRVDDTGLPWLVSDSALSRYNGAYWERLIEGPAYPDWAGYRKVAPVSATEAWVLGWRGLVHLTGSEIETFDSSTVGLTSGWLWSLAYDTASGEVWAGSDSGGLCHGDGTNWTCVTTADGLLSERIRAVEVGFDSVWVGYDDVAGTLAQYQPGSGWLHVDLPTAFASGKVTLLRADPPGTLWVGLADGTLLRYAVGGEGEDAWLAVTAIDGPQTYTTNQVFGVAGMVYSTSWRASEFDGEVWEQAPLDYTTGAELGPANYWLSDPGHLRHSVDGINWDDTDLGSDIRVTRIASDTLSNHLWLGTEEGLWKYDPDTGTVVATWNPADETVAEGNRVVDLEVGADGVVWLIARASHYSGTIARFDPQQNTWTAHYTEMVAYGVAQDSAGKLWFAMRGMRYPPPYESGKIVSFDGATWSEYDQDDGLPWAYVEDVAVDAADLVWVTGYRYEGTYPDWTYWSGFSAWDGAAFTTYYGEYTTLRGIWPDRASGELWAAAVGPDGVIRFNPEGLATTEEILSEGAVVTAADDSGTVAFPPGSLPEGTEVTVVTNPPQDSGVLTGQSSVLEVSWSSESRQAEVTGIYTVTLSYVAPNLGLVTADRLGLYGWNSDSARWEPIESAVHDLARMEISAGASEPGMFQIMGVGCYIYLPLTLRQ